MISTLAIPLLSVVLAQPEPEPTAAPPEPTRRVLLDRTLTERPVQLLAIDDAGVRVVDAQGRTQVVPRSEVLAILPELAPLDPPFVPTPIKRLSNPVTVNDPRQPAPAAPTTGRLELTDGQVLPGSLSPPIASDKDRVAWSSRLWGPVSAPLDNVAAVVLSPERFDSLMSKAKGSQDTVLLRNGDRVEGFLESIDPTNVRIEKNGKKTELPTNRVDGVLLANSVKPGGGAWAWVSGAAAAITNISLSDTGSCTIVARLPGSRSQPSATVTADMVEAVCFEAGALRPLAALPLTAAPATGEDRRWAPPPVVATDAVPLGAADIELPGPMRVEWTLPKGAARIATTLEMPPSARLWGDCEVVVEVISGNGSGTQIARGPLNQSHPQIAVNAPLSNAAKLRVTVDPGPSGPIQDRVVLRRGLVLVQ